MKKRKASGLFRKYFLVTISIILASFVFLGGALLLFVSKLWMDEKTSLLEENTLSVAQNTAAVLGSDYLGESGRGSVIVICNTLHQISNAIDADVFITNTDGQVVYCKEILQSNMALYTGNCMVHNAYSVPADIMADTLKTTVSTTGTLGGALNDVHFVVSSPVVVNGKTVAVVFSTQDVIGGLTPYVAGILRVFSAATLFAFAMAFILVYLVSLRLTKPLREMSAAARQYATGDFSKRIPIRSGIHILGHDETDELITAFNSMAQALATLEMSRRSFVANVSHELKTPMTTIGGFIDGILDGTIEPEKETQYLKIVSDEVKRLARLVTGMLNMSKIEAGELELKPVKFDISEMIFRTLLSFEQIIDKKHIEIKGLDSFESNSIVADKDMINQVVYNLIDNAVKFTPEGGYIEVSSKADSEKVIVRIRNSGMGIPGDEIDKIFERFYKIDKSRSYDVKGAGMGLYIVKTIIELHGGNIVARSEPGQYTEFIFQLPLI
ncbi:MAG: HAMP domain-containing histidine kinase [Ruminococcaceae bacterium]|nr:HAMP domain-containing histidine kinase [Oscillospiraceae bacterium]